MEITLASYHTVMLRHGGPKTQILQTKKHLEKMGIQVRLLDFWDSRDEILNNMDERIPDLVREIKSKMFTFDDLADLDNRVLQKAMTQVDADRLPLALIAATDRAALDACIQAYAGVMGITGEDAGARLAELGVAGIGANCGANLADTEAAVAAIHSVCGDIPVVSKANAGIPVWKGAELEYDATPEILAAHAHRLRKAGISIIGACCGSDPSHIAMIRAVLDGDQPVPDIAPPVATATVGAAERQERRRRRRRRS